MRLVWQLGAVTAIALIGGQGIAAVHEDNPWAHARPRRPDGCARGVRSRVGGTPDRAPPGHGGGREGAGAALGVGTLIGLAVFGLVILQLATNEYYEINGRGSTTGAVGLVGFMAAAVAKAAFTLWRPQAVGELQFWRSVRK